jgi:cytochrome c-type biogenesis protein CcmH
MKRRVMPQKLSALPWTDGDTGRAVGSRRREDRIRLPPIGFSNGRSRWRVWLPLLALVLMLFASLHALAVEPGERLANPALEARAEAIGRTLRCLVCQNESIEESNASLAHDIRVRLRQYLLAGDTDAQVREAIVNRYGEFVLLDPPVRPATYVLWFAPPGLLVLGFIGIAIWIWRRPASVPALQPLDAADQCRLERLLQETDG